MKHLKLELADDGKKIKKANEYPDKNHAKKKLKFRIH